LGKPHIYRAAHPDGPVQGLQLDTQQHPDGEAFACRCEIYVTDPRTESRKTRWVVELAFKKREH